MTLVYVWRNAPLGRWLAYAPGRAGASGTTREQAVAELRKQTFAALQVVESAPPGVAQ
jgi:hypothetical protein